MNNILFVPYQNKPTDRITVPLLVNQFITHGDSVILIQLDDEIPNIPKSSLVQIIKDRGGKFELALKYVQVPLKGKLFLWDSDIDPCNFDPNLFVQIMDANWLDCAHPTLSRKGYHDWQLGFVNEDNLAAGFLGRYMPGLPVMAPVYSELGWERFRAIFSDFIDTSIHAGGGCWSFGLAQVGNLGFIDSMEIIHARPGLGVQPDSIEWKETINSINEAKKLGVHSPIELVTNPLGIGQFRRI